MANIVIKRKLSLEFLGEENKDDYLTFRSIPVIEFDGMINKINGVDKKDNKTATIVMLDILKEYLLDGVYGGDKVVKEDLDGLDGAVVMKCFEILTGRPIEGGEPVDPKVKSESTNISSTEAEVVQK